MLFEIIFRGSESLPFIVRQLQSSSVYVNLLTLDDISSSTWLLSLGTEIIRVYR